jgi:hypothetical protein
VVVEEDVLSCAACHEEHRGEDIDLQAVSSVRCVACHNELRTKDDVHSFYPFISSFAEHPEFAASRYRENADSDIPALHEEAGKGHAVHARAQTVGGKLIDRTPLYFNHAAHLAHEGTLLIDTVPQPDDEKKNIVTENQLRWKKLVCADCHETDAAGRYMLPIKYEQRCASCHPLSYSEELSGGGLGPLSHVELGKVYVEAKARLREFLQKQAASPTESEAAEEPRLPSKFAPAARPEGTLDQRLGALWPDVREVIKGGCAHCHMYRPATAGAEADVAIVPPKIPNRWLPHSKFNHDTHKSYTCFSCHDPRSLEKDNPIRAGEDSDLERELDSHRTADILMPSVAVCQKCHGARGAPAWGNASAECVECHTYHHKTQVK